MPEPLTVERATGMALTLFCNVNSSRRVLSSLGGMISAVSSKLSLYDILSIIVPGVLLLGAITTYIEDASFIKFIPNWISILIFVILSYLLGIINHQLTEMLWLTFRNNPNDIEIWQNAVYSHQLKSYFPKYIITITVCYISLLVIAFVTIRYEFLRWVIGIGVIITLLIFPNSTFPYIRNNKILTKYYRKYYFVENIRRNSNISILESQVSFLKSICLPVCLLADILILRAEKYNLDCKWILFISISVLILIIRTVSLKQGSIYRIVFEDYKYLVDLISHHNYKNTKI